MERFTGFGPGARRFLQELRVNNKRDWFKANKGRYESEVLYPAEQFVVDLGASLRELYRPLSYDTRRNGAGSIMRIHRDIRFSPDKRPYKENLGVIFWIGEGKKVALPAFYFHLDPERSFFYGGQHLFEKPTLQRYREAVDEEESGRALVRILGELKSAGLGQMEEPAYKRVPRGFPKDHPREELLRLGGLGVGRDIEEPLVNSPELVARCRHWAESMSPLIGWLLEMNNRPLREE